MNFMKWIELMMTIRTWKPWFYEMKKLHIETILPTCNAFLLRVSLLRMLMKSIASTSWICTIKKMYRNTTVLSVLQVNRSSSLKTEYILSHLTTVLYIWILMYLRYLFDFMTLVSISEKLIIHSHKISDISS